MNALDENTRTHLMEEFRQCLDRLPLSDDASGNTDGAPAVDLFSLLSEMATLKNEVRLESRQFKGALEEFRQFAEQLNTHTQRIERELERARAEALQLERRTERAMLLELADLRDRLQAGVDAASRPPTSWWARLLPGAAGFAASLAAGQGLTLQRLDDLLDRYEVRPMLALGQPLDPDCMRAVGVENQPELQNGIVLRETRRGFYHRGEILRIAEVIVSKKGNTK